jgi:hypothetical protein
MEAIYFGNAPYWDTGAGSGPWIMADMENGLYSGSNVGSSNPSDPTIDYRFTTAMTAAATATAAPTPSTRA